MPGRTRAVSRAAQITAPRSLKDLDQIVLPDATSSGVSGIDAHDPVVVAVDEHAVIAHVVDGRLGLEAVPCASQNSRNVLLAMTLKASRLCSHHGQ